MASSNTHLFSYNFCGLRVCVLVGGLLCEGLTQQGSPVTLGALPDHDPAAVWLRLWASFLDVDWGLLSDPRACSHISASWPTTSGHDLFRLPGEGLGYESCQPSKWISSDGDSSVDHYSHLVASSCCVTAECGNPGVSPTLSRGERLCGALAPWSVSITFWYENKAWNRLRWGKHYFLGNTRVCKALC